VGECFDVHALDGTDLSAGARPPCG
jgi:hypothetical protein